jgi:hypothetical protein
MKGLNYRGFVWGLWIILAIVCELYFLSPWSQL